MEVNRRVFPDCTPYLHVGQEMGNIDVILDILHTVHIHWCYSALTRLGQSIMILAIGPMKLVRDSFQLFFLIFGSVGLCIVCEAVIGFTSSSDQR